MEWRCPDESPRCGPTTLCVGCYGRELAAKRAQARVAGQCWAERVARRPECRNWAWPADARKMRSVARRQIAALAADPRLVEELALACITGAATWWERRPERYR